MSQSYPPSEAQLPAIGDESEATGEQPVSSPEAPGDRWFLDNRINTLNRNAAEASPAQQVYRTTSAIIVLVRNELSDNKDSVELSEYCFNMCVTLKTAIQGKDADDLSEPARMGLKELERLTSEIERTLKRWANTPHTEYNKDEVDGHKLEIRQILGTLAVSRSLLDGNLSIGERGPNLAPVNPHGIATISVSGENAFGLLIRRAFDPCELPLLVEAVFSSKNEREIIRSLSGDNAQTFVDVIDEALDGPDLSSQTRKKCLKSLYRTCRRHALLPKALKIPLCYDRTGVAKYRGGFADVWKGEHYGREVAVKVLRTYSDSNLKRILGKFCKEVVTWKALRHPNVLPLIGVTMSDTQFAMVSDWMVNGNINDFVKAHPDANRIELLGDVTKGLIYIHSQGMCHGDLKGANILIDQTGRARLADFGLLTIISDPTNFLSTSSYTQGGTARWMSPELIAPQRFGLEDSRPTKSSDCYALGMVIYETISGHLPFHKHPDLVVFTKVLEGERPPRPVGFTNSLWEMLEPCWAHQPNTRPSIEEVLQYLERASQSLGPPSPGVNGEMDQGDNWDSESDSSVQSAPGNTGINPRPSSNTTPSSNYDPLPSIPSPQSSSASSGIGRGRGTQHPSSTVDSHDYINHQNRDLSSPTLFASYPDNNFDFDFTAPSPNLPQTPSYNGLPYTAYSELEFDGSLIVLDEQVDYHPSEYDAPSNNQPSVLDFTNPRDQAETSAPLIPNTDFDIPSNYYFDHSPFLPPDFDHFPRRSQSDPTTLPQKWYTMNPQLQGNKSPFNDLDQFWNSYPFPQPGLLSDLNNVKQQSPSPPTNIAPSVRGRQGRSLSDPKKRGIDWMVQHGAPGSARAGPYPNPHASPSQHRPKPNGMTSHIPPKASERRGMMDTNFVCPVPGCGSTFTRHFNLRGHMRSHNEGKPFQCEWPGCGKGFATSHDCKRHEQLHPNYRPHRCEGCGKSFQETDALEQHLRSEDGQDCQEARDEALVDDMINPAGLSYGNLVGSGPRDPVDSFVATGLDSTNS